MNRYGLTDEAERTMVLNSIFSSGVHLSLLCCFISSGQAPFVYNSPPVKRRLSPVLLATNEQNHTGAFFIFA